MINMIGHSNWPIEKFVDHLRASGITMLLDVRSKPYSRYCPQFNHKALEASIRAAGLAYRWRGEKLGGFGENNPDMAPTLDTIVDHVRSTPGLYLAMMCSERDPRECHRFYWLGNYIARTAPDMHLRSLTVGQPDWHPQLGDFPPLPEWLARAAEKKLALAA